MAGSNGYQDGYNGEWWRNMGKQNERVYQASPATCVSVARKAARAAMAELDKDSPDLHVVRTELGVVRAWLPEWLEGDWDDRMCEWMHRDGAPVNHEEWRP